MSSGAGAGWETARERFLAALELPEADRVAFLAALAEENPELAREVAELLRIHARSGGDLEQPALARLGAPPESEQKPPERIGPWKLEREIGRGGMGVVWLARRDDGSFEQTVAIKLVRPELASDLLRRRLLGEMRILAGLGHESIARLLDGGATPEGVPYLVLEYVAGEPIDLHCDSRRLGLAERLRLFLDVCGTVEFAHRRLVLHRDLKSSNILVDERGQPKLLDFGIAKLLGSPADGEQWTALGFERPLTPEWASPEQLRGEELTTASDVYSLGVLLHVLLTGRRPHRWTGQRPEQFAREIEESGDTLFRGFADRALAPGVEGRAVRGDLEWIVARALAPEAAARYGTAAELGAEIERHLAGRPVLAHPPTLVYRARRFVRRHRAAVTATAVAVASLIAATAISLRQARIAERRFGEVRELANRFLFDFEEQIRDLPGSTPAREKVVATAKEYLDRLASEAGDDIGLLDELAQAYLKVGDLEGHPKLANLGHADRARASYERGRALGEQLSALDPESVAGWSHRVTAELRLGDLALDAGDAGEAEARYRAALPLAEQAVELTEEAAGGSDDVGREGEPGPRRQLGQVLQRLGTVALGRGEYESARVALESYRDHTQAALARDPRGRESTRDRMVAALLLGDVFDEWGKPAEALPIYEEALRQSEDRQKAFPGAESGRDWSIAVQRVIIALRKLDRHEEALGLAQRALDWTEQAAAADPMNSRLKRDLAESLADVGRELAALGRPQEALVRFERSRAMFESLAAAEPGSAEIRSYLAAALYFEADARLAVRDIAGAEFAMARCVEIESALAAAAPDDVGQRENLAASLKLLGRLRLDRSDLPAARTALERAVELEEELTRGAGRNAERDAALAMALFLRGRASRDVVGRCADFARAASLAEALSDGDLDPHLLSLAELRSGVAGCARTAS